jgi:hypothetical protein
MVRTRKPSWVRLIVNLLVLAAVGVGLVMLGVRDVGFIWVSGAVVGTGAAVYRRSRPEPPGKRQGSGWRMDPGGDYRWWDGSKWTESPPGETPRKIGPEIEW